MFRDIRINLANQALEVGRFERRDGFENEYPFRQKQLVFKHVSSSYFVSCRHRFVQPLSRSGDVSVIEVFDRRFRERLADRHHDVLPLLIPDHRKPFDTGEVFGVKLDFLPDRGGFPAMETGHVEQHA
jgi:hypothetical protein